MSGAVAFIPAYADRFCANCGFPFRNEDRNQRYCREYQLPNHGRCGRRLRDAQSSESLEARLRKTQEADSFSLRTSEDAIAHAWVRQHYPDLDLEPWQPDPTSVEASVRRAVGAGAPSRAFLVTWNPESYQWENDGYFDTIDATAYGKMVADDWSVGNRVGGISPGDRAYLYRYRDHRGIVASGTFRSGVESRSHWDGAEGTANLADLDWECVLHYEDVLPVAELIEKVPDMPWMRLQGSGQEIKPSAAGKLAELWGRHIREKVFRSPDEPHRPGIQVFSEGAVSRIEVNRFERDPRARRACIEHWGYRCVVCAFSFEERYGELGRNYIHVHHVIELSRLPEGYLVNPTEDLRPLCPNCHAMIHRGPDRALTIEELKQHLRQAEGATGQA